MVVKILPREGLEPGTARSVGQCLTHNLVNYGTNQALYIVKLQGPYSQTRLKLHLDSNLPDKQL